MTGGYGLIHERVCTGKSGDVVIGVCGRLGVGVCVTCGTAVSNENMTRHMRKLHDVSTKNPSNFASISLVKSKVTSDIHKARMSFQPYSDPLLWCKQMKMYKCPLCEHSGASANIVRRHVRTSHTEHDKLCVAESELTMRLVQTVSKSKVLCHYVPVTVLAAQSSGNRSAEVRQSAVADLDDLSPLRKGRTDHTLKDDLNVRNVSIFAKKTRMLQFKAELGVDCEVAYALGGKYQTGVVEKAIVPVVKEIMRKEYRRFQLASTANIEVLRSVPVGMEGGRGERGFSGLSDTTALESYPVKCARLILFVMRCFKERNGDAKQVWKWFDMLHIEEAVSCLCSTTVESDLETTEERANRLSEPVWSIFRAILFNCWCHPLQLMTPVWAWVVCLCSKKERGKEPCFSFLGSQVSPFIAAARLCAVLVGHRLLRTGVMTQNQIRSCLQDPNSPQSVFRTLLNGKNDSAETENQKPSFQVSVDPMRPYAGSVDGVTHDPSSIGECIRNMQKDLRAGLEELFFWKMPLLEEQVTNDFLFDWDLLREMSAVNEPDESRLFLRVGESKGDSFLCKDAISPQFLRRVQEVRLQSLVFARRLCENTRKEMEMRLPGKKTSVDRWLVKSDEVSALLLVTMNGCGAQSTRTTEMSSLQYKTGEFGFKRELRFLKGIAQIVPGFSKTNLIVGSRNLDTNTGHILIMYVLTVLVVRGYLRKRGYVQMGDSVGGANHNQAECFLAAHTSKLQSRLSSIMRKLTIQYYGLSPSRLRHLVTGIFRQVGRTNRYGALAADDAWLPEAVKKAAELGNGLHDVESVHSYLTRTRQHSRRTEDAIYAIEQGGLEAYSELDKGRITSGFVHHQFGLGSKCVDLYLMRVRDELYGATYPRVRSEVGPFGLDPSALSDTPARPVPVPLLPVDLPTRQLQGLTDEVQVVSPDVPSSNAGMGGLVPPLERVLEFSQDDTERLRIAMRQVLNNDSADWKSMYQRQGAEFVWKHRVGGTCEPADVMVILPTGGGKSLVYQVSMFLQKGKAGLMILLVPYKALTNQICDQLEDLGLNVLTISSVWKGGNTVEGIIRAARKGSLDGLVLSIECLSFEKNTDLVHRLNVEGLVSYIFVDEAHSIHGEKNFRRGANYVSRQLRRPGIPDRYVPGLGALSATVSPSIQDSVMASIGMSPKHTRVIRSPSGRPNAVYRVVRMKSRGDDALVSQIRDDVEQYFYQGHNGKILIFFKKIDLLTRVAETIEADMLSKEDARQRAVVVSYHGQLTSSVKMEAYKRIVGFVPSGNLPNLIVLATIGFGAGVDIPDFRWVLVVSGADNMQMLCQMFGRGGRDEKQYEAELLVESSGVYSPEDRRVQEYGSGGDVCLRRLLQRAMDGDIGDHDCRDGVDLKCNVCEINAICDRPSKVRKVMPTPDSNISPLEVEMKGTSANAVEVVHEENLSRSRKRDNVRRFLQGGFIELGGLCHLCFVKGKRGDALRHETCDLKCGLGVCFDCCGPTSVSHVTRSCSLKESRGATLNGLPRCYYCGLNSILGIELHECGEFGKGERCPFRLASRWAHSIRSVATVSLSVRKVLRCMGSHPSLGDIVAFDHWLTSSDATQGGLPIVGILEMLTGPDGSGLMDSDSIPVRIGGILGEKLSREFPCGYCMTKGCSDLHHFYKFQCRGSQCTICAGSGHFARNCPFKLDRIARKKCVGCGLGKVRGEMIHEYHETCKFRSWGLFMLGLMHIEKREKFVKLMGEAGVGHPPLEILDIDRWLSDDRKSVGPRYVQLLHYLF